MLLKNKTTHTQSIYLSDGSIVSARPYRTIIINEKVDNLNQNVWEVVGENESLKKKKEIKE